MVPGYEHVPGQHCGSTAIRNVLRFHGVGLSEEMALGLGAGACFYYVTIESESPTRFTNGRAHLFEQQFVELTGAPLRYETAEDERDAWSRARHLVDTGRPAILLTDLYYLDHYGRSAHFPGHAVVLAGYDGEVAYLSDTGFEGLQTTRVENLARARSAKHPARELSGDMLYLPAGIELVDPRAAIPAAVSRGAREMLEPTFGELQGIPALRRLADEAPLWPRVTDDWRWCARFNYQAIERRGTGGGNFRTMYARFLEEAGYEEAELARDASARWTELAGALYAASEEAEPVPELWSRIGEECQRVLDAEERLWTALASTS
jgi:hypothetical protein